MTDEELASLYGDDYFHGAEYLNYASERASLEINFRRRISTLKRLGALKESSSVFEIGSAYGYFLKVVESEVAEARGIDISESAAAIAREMTGAKVTTGDFLVADIRPPPDLIVMWDVIEHLSRPDLFVKKAGDILNLGGHIAITTGDIGSLNARIRGRRWRMIHPPTHLHYFSTKSIACLLQKAGFELVSISHPGTVRQLRSILYGVLVLRLGSASLYDRLSHWSLLDTGLSLNLFDIMLVVARKKDHR